MGKRLAVSITIFLLMVFAIVVPNSIAKSVKPTQKGVLDLVEKDLWGCVVAKGAKGKLFFKLEGPFFDFKIRIRGLEPNKGYALIRSLEPVTNLPYCLEVLAEGTSNDKGHLLIKDSYNFDIDLISAEFLLVPVDMLDLVTNGRPSPSGRYLSGQGLIGYNDTDTELKCGCQASGTSFDQVGIPVGEKAVDFTLKSTTDEVFVLYEFLGQEQKPLVLIFGAYT